MGKSGNYFGICRFPIYMATNYTNTSGAAGSGTSVSINVISQPAEAPILRLTVSVMKEECSLQAVLFREPINSN